MSMRLMLIYIQMFPSLYVWNNYITNNINETYNILIEADKLTYSVLETINHHIEKSNGKDFKIRW